MLILTRMHQLRAPWMAWWLALVLVVAPALGRMHEVLHAPGLPQAQVMAASHAPTHDVHDLFGEHSALECLTLDQLSHGDSGPTALAMPCLVLPHSQPVWSANPAHLPTADALFQARAPPRVMA